MRNIFFIILYFFICVVVTAQSRMYDGPDDPAGDKAAERVGFMTGNRVLVQFRNTSELSDCCGLGYDVSKWPNNYDGTKMHDGIATLIGAKVFLENDSIPVPTNYEGRTDLDTLYYIESSYREHMDFDKSLTVEYGLYPVFGYFNPLSETPAMSNSPNSWPLEGWPTKDGTKWQGEWNGRFGRGVVKADLATFFVANDAQDQEYLEEGNTIKYYPRPNVKIGDINPNVTIQKGKPWGGLGIRLETRGFQWSNVAATDAIFWEHNISNISDYDLPEVLLGFWMDNAVGGEEGTGDDLAFYSKKLNMAYSWDIDFIPVGGGKQPGTLGFAYLESPGLPYDNIDNDNDGLLNEKRDNIAVAKIGPKDGIDNLEKFLQYYNLKEEDLKEHWDADEDQDWKFGTDLNNNGKYAYYDEELKKWKLEPGDDPGNDVGLDGVGPRDINYTGPDADGTEGNNKPDYAEGVGCEPNFAITDISESDMIGLTSFHYTSDIERVAVIRTDESLYKYMETDEFHDFQNQPLNFMEFFSSGPFPLYKGRTERISMAELHSYDPLAGLMSDEHSAPSLFRLKEVVQVIYETDYRFAQPPLMPTLTATPSDGKIILTWDDVADKLTKEEFANNINDFEGYKLYRATDKKMSDAELITDGYGNLILKKPIFQCDKIDGITGFADYGEINGIEFYLGDDTGIQNYYIDEDVQNGRTYYYVLVAYDYGLKDVGDGIGPSENNFVIRLDETENVIDITKNVAIVEPHQLAAGYVPPSIEILDKPGENFFPDIISEQYIKENHTYRVYFDVDTVTHLRLTELIRHPADAYFVNNGFRVYDVTDNNSLIYSEDKNNFSGKNIVPDKFQLAGGLNFEYNTVNPTLITTGMIDGVQLNFKNVITKPKLNLSETGWINGDSEIKIAANPYESQFYPWKYNIVFTNNEDAYTTKTNKIRGIKNTDNQPLGPVEAIFGYNFNFYVINKERSNEDGTDEILDLLVYDKNRNKKFDYDEDEVLVGYTVENRGKYYWAGTIFSINFADAYKQNNLPKAGDIYQVSFDRAFTENEYFEFKLLPENALDKKSLKEQMDKIKVVPNPYVMTNSFEPSVLNYQLNQERRIMFTNIPARCKIKIYTVSGMLVDEIYVDNNIENRKTNWDTNTNSNGTVKWDLKTREGLEISSGYYIYKVIALETGDEKVGKFAVIK